MTFQATTNSNVNAQEAQRLVNQQIVTELGTGLIARDPKLITNGRQVVWRIPIVLSLPDLGDLGQVGTVDVDAQSGSIVTTTDSLKKIIQRSRSLYAATTS